jgi:hypothetical protein
MLSIRRARHVETPATVGEKERERDGGFIWICWHVIRELPGTCSLKEGVGGAVGD